jgi:hypothetical protein
MLTFVCLKMVLSLTQDRCTVCAECTIGSEIGPTRWCSKVTWAMWTPTSGCLETVSVSVQDRCTVCAKHTIVLEIILDAPDGSTR